jgi:hypothetical protein
MTALAGLPAYLQLAAVAKLPVSIKKYTPDGSLKRIQPSR